MVVKYGNSCAQIRSARSRAMSMGTGTGATHGCCCWSTSRSTQGFDFDKDSVIVLRLEVPQSPEQRRRPLHVALELLELGGREAPRCRVRVGALRAAMASLHVAASRIRMRSISEGSMAPGSVIVYFFLIDMVFKM